MPGESAIYKRFEGKTVLVTGAGTGFGSTIAFRAGQEGARVGIHYNRSRDGAEATAGRVRGLGAEAAVFQADISSWDAVKAMAICVIFAEIAYAAAGAALAPDLAALVVLALLAVMLMAVWRVPRHVAPTAVTAMLVASFPLGALRR